MWLPWKRRKRKSFNQKKLHPETPKKNQTGGEMGNLWGEHTDPAMVGMGYKEGGREERGPCFGGHIGPSRGEWVAHSLCHEGKWGCLWVLGAEGG